MLLFPSMSVEQARALVMALPPEERVALAVELLESTEPEDEDAEEAWEQEIARRVAQLERNEVVLIPHDEVLRRVGRSPRP